MRARGPGGGAGAPGDCVMVSRLHRVVQVSEERKCARFRRCWWRWPSWRAGEEVRGGVAPDGPGRGPGRRPCRRRWAIRRARGGREGQGPREDRRGPLLVPEAADRRRARSGPRCRRPRRPVGAEVEHGGGMAMDGFESKTLGRKFDKILFGQLGGGVGLRPRAGSRRRHGRPAPGPPAGRLLGTEVGAEGREGHRRQRQDRRRGLRPEGQLKDKPRSPYAARS